LQLKTKSAEGDCSFALLMVTVLAMVCGGLRGQRLAVARAHCGKVAKAGSGIARVRISRVVAPRSLFYPPLPNYNNL
jgi:hypothetical protein